MRNWDFLQELIRQYNLELRADADKAVLTDRRTGARVEIYAEESRGRDPKEDGWVEYIVCFSTQHRHFEDQSDAMEYLQEILTDEVLPIEFYLHGKRRFGGEIKKEDFDGLTAEFLAAYYGCTAAELSQFEYEIHSWSGNYDTGRRRVDAL